MNKNKQMYLSPETEVLVVRFEDGILTTASPNLVYGNKGAAGADADYNSYDEDF